MERMIGITQGHEQLPGLGYSDVSYDFDAMISDIAGLGKCVADNEMAVSTSVQQARNLQALAATWGLSSPEGWAVSDERAGLDATIASAELYLIHVKRAKKMSSQTSPRCSTTASPRRTPCR